MTTQFEKIVLLSMLGLNLKEIAYELGITYGSAKFCLFASRKKARDQHRLQEIVSALWRKRAQEAEYHSILDSVWITAFRAGKKS